MRIFVTDTWDPRQYDKCQRERDQPFFDLLALDAFLDGDSGTHSAAPWAAGAAR